MPTNFDDNRSDIGERESVSAPNSSVLQEPIDIKLLAAESVIWTEKNVAYIGPFGKVPGKLVITRYRMVFLVGDGGKHFKRWKLDVPLGHVSKVEKVGGQSRSAAMRGGDDNYGFIVLCKDYRNYKFACLVGIAYPLRIERVFVIP
ncbi:hypothetical protein B9Z55_000628 [Caenorhabditis nigoni]|uniref:GRAM domain-containing protein n=1 Tax=Caenorhabditis nigoni TaxID=1611254 RepID=A0A2G5VU00_9PELO|nr:hypothetical protein B9Z55_000628 [Caenorhabditis nigoni]